MLDYSQLRSFYGGVYDHVFSRYPNGDFSLREIVDVDGQEMLFGIYAHLYRDGLGVGFSINVGEIIQDAAEYLLHIGIIKSELDEFRDIITQQDIMFLSEGQDIDHQLYDLSDAIEGFLGPKQDVNGRWYFIPMQKESIMRVGKGNRQFHRISFDAYSSPERWNLQIFPPSSEVEMMGEIEYVDGEVMVHPIYREIEQDDIDTINIFAQRMVAWYGSVLGRGLI